MFTIDKTAWVPQILRIKDPLADCSLCYKDSRGAAQNHRDPTTAVVLPARSVVWPLGKFSVMLCLWRGFSLPFFPVFFNNCPIAGRLGYHAVDVACTWI
jgi:hypothetical protein